MMNRTRLAILSIIMGVSFVSLAFSLTASAESSDALVCTYEPMDLFMDKNLSSLVSTQIQTHGVNVKTIGRVDQILGNDKDCTYVIKIDRAINENYRYTDHTTKYLISGNSAIIFAYKTAATFNPVSGEILKPMTNWSCETTAHGSKYHDDYHISNEGYFQTYTGYCDPYQGSVQPSRMGELPYNVIRNSVDSVLETLGL